MQRALDLLEGVVADLRNPGRPITAENVALISSTIATAALLERELGRRAYKMEKKS
jgi:hypothetical protein